MLVGLTMSIAAGILLSIQNIFNSKVNERAGTWVTTTLVLAMGFLASFIIGFIVEGRHLFSLNNMQPWFYFSGMIGVCVVVCLVNGLKRLEPTYAISIVLSSQLFFALLWDSLGWFGLTKVPFSYKQLVAVLLVVGGIIIFKLGENRRA